MKLTFILDKAYDREKTEAFLEKEDLEYFDTHYELFLPFMEDSLEGYQSSWNKINDQFSAYIEKETSHTWFSDEYECVISLLLKGISNWYEPKVMRGWRENAYVQRRITAHEIIIHHIFEMYRLKYAHHGLSDDQVWALAEIAAWALASLTEEGRSFWPWDRSGYYYTHNYPELVELQKRLKNPFLQRETFDGYLEEGIRLVKNEELFHAPATD